MHNIAYLYTQYDRGAVLVLFPQGPAPETVRITRVALNQIHSLMNLEGKSYQLYVPTSQGLSSALDQLEDLERLVGARQPPIPDATILENVLKDQIFKEASGIDTASIRGVSTFESTESMDQFLIMGTLALVVSAYACYYSISTANSSD